MNDQINFTIEKHNSQYFVCHSGSNESIIKTHLDTPYPGLSEDVAVLLCEDLNSLPLSSIEKGNLNASLVYCVLSTFIAGGADYRFEIDLPFCIQWDRAYRLNSGPPYRQVEFKAISKIAAFHQGKWVDLPLNYCESLEEMRERKFQEVPLEITDDLQTLLIRYNSVEHFTVDLLFTLFQRISISAAILWVAGIIDNMELLKICLILFDEKDSDEFSKEEIKYMKKMNSKLDRLRKLIQISKDQDRIS